MTVVTDAKMQLMECLFVLLGSHDNLGSLATSLSINRDGKKMCYLCLNRNGGDYE